MRLLYMYIIRSYFSQTWGNSMMGRRDGMGLIVFVCVKSEFLSPSPNPSFRPPLNEGDNPFLCSDLLRKTPIQTLMDSPVDVSRSVDESDFGVRRTSESFRLRLILKSQYLSSTRCGYISGPLDDNSESNLCHFLSVDRRD